MGHDLVIRGGRVVDGTGAPAATADVAIDTAEIPSPPEASESTLEVRPVVEPSPSAPISAPARTISSCAPRRSLRGTATARRCA